MRTRSTELPGVHRGERRYAVVEAAKETLSERTRRRDLGGDTVAVSGADTRSESADEGGANRRSPESPAVSPDDEDTMPFELSSCPVTRTMIAGHETTAEEPRYRKQQQNVMMMASRNRNNAAGHW
ncbi:GH17208 [Drosophila grimshawi]|uniref:GH17208 n=1 Tax=Drosophila grimshawi TaxID=7222 RepID=B4J1W2_DROGR|nr:GH17208 [Drosophila grimshawi]